MYGLDLFSGIGGITKALEGYVTPVAYCENDRYAQGVLLSRMATRDLPIAPIWDDITTLDGRSFKNIDIIYGGFPCQDISVAGRGAGLAGERSGLFFEIVRLISEIRPAFIFLENVPAIRNRGADTVCGELAGLGYDCRWITLSAAEVGANHRRERWWLLAHARHRCGRDIGATEAGQDASKERGGDHDATGGPGEQPTSLANANRLGEIGNESKNGEGRRAKQDGENMAHPDRPGLRKRWGPQHVQPEHGTVECGGETISNSGAQSVQGVKKRGTGRQESDSFRADWWQSEPRVGRVVNGLPMRVDRLRALGNSVVAQCAREAFERLMGLK